MSNTTCTRFQTGFLPPLFGTEFIIALVGNVFAIGVLILKERKNWHSGMVFSFNLAVSDVLYALTLPLLIVYYNNNRKWPFGTSACKIERFLFTCNLYSSIFFVMCISVNRWVAIVYPLFTRNYVEPKHAKIASGLMWVLVIAMSAPVLVFADTCGVKRLLCQSYCDDNKLVEVAHFKYKVFLAVVGCLVPMIVTFSSYVHLIWVIYKNANISSMEKRKVALMVVSVLVLYVTSFVPYHILQMSFLYIRMNSIVVCWIYNLYQVGKGLVGVNMCIHPILYLAVFDSIRVLCCGKCTEK